MSNFPDGMSTDDWNYINGKGKYAEDYDSNYVDEGPDPDDANDARREQEWEASQEPDYDRPLFEHSGE